MEHLTLTIDGIERDNGTDLPDRVIDVNFDQFETLI